MITELQQQQQDVTQAACFRVCPDLAHAFVGEFYMPCWYEDHACFNQYERGMAAGTWDLTNTVVSPHFRPSAIRQALPKVKP